MLYKYRSIQNFKLFADIILNQRLFVASYFDMNDPMEGHYRYTTGELTNEIIDAIKGEKEKLKICSLSRVHDNGLMWAHYADGHKGVAIGVEVDQTNCEVRPVNYDGLSIVNNNHGNSHQETAKRILSHKLDFWRYEQEERIFVTDNTNFASVSVKEIYLGCRMSNQDKSIVRKLVENANLNTDINISIHTLSEPPA